MMDQYTQDILQGLFVGTREEWRAWSADPVGYEERRRESRINELRQRISARTVPVLDSFYGDPLKPLECIIHPKNIVFTKEQSEWLTKHYSLAGGHKSAPSHSNHRPETVIAVVVRAAISLMIVPCLAVLLVVILLA